MTNVSKYKTVNCQLGGKFHRDIRGGIHSKEHWGGCHLPGVPLATYHMSIMWGGVDGQVHDSQLQMIAQSGAGD